MSKKKPKPYSPLDPNIVNELQKHCDAGWSARSFIGKLQGGEASWSRLCDSNPRFKELAAHYLNQQFQKRKKALQSVMGAVVIR